MKLKQIVSFSTLPVLIALMSVSAGISYQPVVRAAAASCESLYTSAPVASDKAKAKAVQLLKACNKGADTDKCDGLNAGSETTKKEKEDACQRGREYLAENPPADTTATETTETTETTGSLNVDGDDCGGVKTAIIKCDAKNSGDLTDNGVWALLILVLNILTAGVGILAVAGIVYGAILYTTAEDKADQVKKATGIITNVVIGLIFYALMWAGLNFIVPGGVFAT